MIDLYSAIILQDIDRFGRINTCSMYINYLMRSEVHKAMTAVIENISSLMRYVSEQIAIIRKENIIEKSYQLADMEFLGTLLETLLTVEAAIIGWLENE